MARIVSKRLKKARSETPAPSSKSLKTPDRIPRPPNAFILFRKDLNAKARANGETHQRAVSGAARDLWAQYKAEESSEYHFWNGEAERVKQEHVVKYPGYSYKPRKRTTVKKKRRSRQDAGVDAEQKAMVLAAARGGSSVVGSPLLYAYEGLAPYSPTSTISWASSPGLKSSRSPISSDSSAPLSSPPITPPTRTRRLTRAAAKKTSARHKIADAEAAASTLPLSPLATSPNGLMLITESPIQNHLPSLASSPSSPYFALPASPASTYTPEYAYDHLPQVGDALGTIGMHNMVSAYLTPIDYTGDAKDVHAQFSTFSFNPQVPDSHGVPQLFLQTQVPDTYVSPPSLSYDLPPPLEVPYEMALKPNGQDEYLPSYTNDTCYDQTDILYFYQ